MPPQSRLLAATLLAGSLAAGVMAAFAQAVAPVPAAATSSLSMPDLLDRLAAQGYRDARSIERESDKLVEVKAIGPDGRRHELHVDARTGEVLKAERD